MAWVMKKHRSHISGKRIYSSELIKIMIEFFIKKEKKLLAEFKAIEAKKEGVENV